LHRPSGAIIWARQKLIVASGDSTTLTPPASAIWHSPARKL
jgi:hypothetical protein